MKKILVFMTVFFLLGATACTTSDTPTKGMKSEAKMMIGGKPYSIADFCLNSPQADICISTNGLAEIPLNEAKPSIRLVDGTVISWDSLEWMTGYSAANNSSIPVGITVPQGSSLHTGDSYWSRLFDAKDGSLLKASDFDGTVNVGGYMGLKGATAGQHLIHLAIFERGGDETKYLVLPPITVTE